MADEDTETELDPHTQAAVKLAIEYSTNNLAKVIDRKLEAFSQKFSLENTSVVNNAVKRAKRESYTCKRKGNQQQLDYCQEVLEKIDDSLHHLKSQSYEKAKRSLEDGSYLVCKRIKAIKLADKSEFGWLTVNEYLSDELASDSDDEKRMWRSERRAEKKVRDKQRQKKNKREERFSYSNSSRNDDRPTRRLGPCFKISIFVHHTLHLVQALF